MTQALKLLADGQLTATSETVIYTVPSSTTTAVTDLVLHNTGAADQTVQVYVRHGSTSRVVGYFILKQHYTAQQSFGLILGAGDTLRLKTTTANVLDYVLSGVENT